MTPALTREIGLEGLVKSFVGPSGPVRAVRGIDITIRVSQTIALLGPNGAGKATTLDMLLGLARPNSEASRCWAARRGRRSRPAWSPR